MAEKETGQSTPDNQPGQGRLPEPRTFMECGAAMPGDSMERFISTFERSARRWELVVYPALFAFMVLAAYGFFLIYSLTHDMRIMANAIDPNMGEHMVALADNMVKLSDNISVMTDQVNAISTDMRYMSGKMDAMDNLGPMRVYMQRMDESMRSMVITTDMMHKDIAVMSSNVSRPMSTINKMMPW